MTIHSDRSWVVVLVAALGFGANSLPAACSEPIRVLLVMPKDSAELSQRVSQIDDALLALGGGVVGVTTLAEADVVIQFTDYRRTTSGDGQVVDYWNGQLKLLSPSSEDLEPLAPLTNGFMLVQIGREQAEPAGIVVALAQMLLKQLGREVERPGGDPV